MMFEELTQLFAHTECATIDFGFRRNVQIGGKNVI